MDSEKRPSIVSDGHDALNGSNLVTPDGEFPMSQSFMNLSAAEQDQRREQWKSELAELEFEIHTLRQVLQIKTRKVHELKRKLGISAWREIGDDISQSLKNVKESSTFKSIEEAASGVGSAIAANPVYQKVENTVGGVSQAVAASPAYQKTETVIKVTAEKTTSFFGGLGSNLSQKIGGIKETATFKSLEEKVGSAYTNVKSKVVTSRSNSTHDFEEALKEAEAKRAEEAVTPTAPPTTQMTPSENQ
ncbi:tumor protein D54-like isoform X2 [Artemia franciscana]|uniref:tumor protein D54-like isoform X2 n=1 Tax=Artemia franciscana TaxID=6661 RepID=UPI0032DADD2C